MFGWAKFLFDQAIPQSTVKALFRNGRVECLNFFLSIIQECGFLGLIKALRNRVMFFDPHYFKLTQFCFCLL
ncbi:Uncharacterised protein [Vibrio cholerae]|uniref:Uncharacterized protein n=1 Tax=Vibrio cholerae TaxID=666 RepID=A0A655WHJ2_VIBCL|nr:Uncharacterised protein [Vibrio cholerae]